ncbi:MAG: hypothetical protein HY074_12255 [Deltaproteobacteria bacterium]|nr:hypothetical protein [Deltaproteobacteria bacterium]
MRLPAWLKILIILLLSFIVFSVLGAVSPYIIPLVLAVSLMLFPGNDLAAPRLVKVMPWFWGLEILVSFVFIALDLAGKKLFESDQRQPTAIEIWSGIILTAPLIWLIVKRHKAFRPMLVLATLVNLAIGFWVYSGSLGDIKAKFELAGGVSTELLVSIYLLMKVRPKKAGFA